MRGPCGGCGVLVHNTNDPPAQGNDAAKAQNIQQQINRLREMKAEAQRQNALARVNELSVEIQRLQAEIDAIFGIGH
jgi:hypothetical protein